MLFLTLSVAYEVSTLRKHSQTHPSSTTNKTSVNQTDPRKINQANRLSLGILFISILFLLIPSTLVAIGDWVGINIFARIGPFYLIGLLLDGVANSLIYIMLHVEVRRAAVQFVSMGKGRCVELDDQ